MKKECQDALLHDLNGSLSKLKTALSLMESADLTEIREDYIPLLRLCAEDWERQLTLLKKEWGA